MDGQGCSLWDHRDVWALGGCCVLFPEPAAPAKALPHAGLVAANPLSLKAEASESQHWGGRQCFDHQKPIQEKLINSFFSLWNLWMLAL